MDQENHVVAVEAEERCPEYVALRFMSAIMKLIDREGVERARQEFLPRALVCVGMSGAEVETMTGTLIEIHQRHRDEVNRLVAENGKRFPISWACYHWR